MTERLLMLDDVAKILNISPRSVRRLKKLRRVRIGVLIRYRAENVDAFIKESSEQT